MNLNCRSCHTSIPKKRSGNHNTNNNKQAATKNYNNLQSLFFHQLLIYKLGGKFNNESFMHATEKNWEDLGGYRVLHNLLIFVKYIKSKFHSILFRKVLKLE